MIFAVMLYITGFCFRKVDSIVIHAVMEISYH